MPLRLDYVVGVSPSKWLRAWADRRPDLPLEAERVDGPDQLARLRSGGADLAFVRLPVRADGLHAIPLWEEIAVVALPRDHAFAEASELSLADLDGEPVAPGAVSAGEAASSTSASSFESDDAPRADPELLLELVAAGTGYAILPHSLARLHHRRDVVAVPLVDAPTTRIALVWLAERDDDDIQEFVGVVRGRTARSSRGAEHPDGAAAAPAGAKAGTKAAAKKTAPKSSGSRTAKPSERATTRHTGGGKRRGGRR